MNLVDIQPEAAVRLPRLSRRMPTAAPHIHIETVRPLLNLALAGFEPGVIHASGPQGDPARLNNTFEALR